MEFELTQNQLDAVQATLNEMDRGLDKRKLMNELLFGLFPNEDQKFLDYWAGHRYVQLKGTAFHSTQEWILKDMVREVVRGSAQLWYESWD